MEGSWFAIMPSELDGYAGPHLEESLSQDANSGTEPSSCLDIINCCPIFDETWKWDNVQKLVEDLTQPPPPPKKLNGRDYEDLPEKPLVTVDMELISPTAAPHHQFDEEWKIDEDTMEKVTRDLVVRRPWGIACHPVTEEVFVADRAYHCILVFAADGTYLRRIGRGPGSDAACFQRPTGVAIDSKRNRLFVTDKDNHRVQVFDCRTGDFLFCFGKYGHFQGQFKYPWGIAVFEDYVAVADPRNFRLQLFSSDGVFIREFFIATERPDQRKYSNIFNQPRGLAFDNSGQFLYVTDFKLRRVLRLTIEFTRLDCVVSEGFLNRPNGISVDAAGNLVLVDTRDSAVKVFSPDGVPLFRIDRLGSQNPVLFDLPQDLALLPTGHITLLDSNGRIQIF